MEIALGLAVIAAIAFVIWLWGKFTSAVSAGANRHLFQRGTHRTGQIVRDDPLQFETTGPRDEVRAWILAQIPLEAHRPSMMSALFIEGQDEMTTRLVFGSLVRGDEFVIDLDMDQRGPVTAGVVSLQSWTERDGVMSASKKVAEIFAAVDGAVRRADPAARVHNPLTA